jgi:hypothetical protein
MNAVRTKAFGGTRFPYFWVIGVSENGYLHVHLALGVEILQNDLDELWGRGIAHGPSEDMGGPDRGGPDRVGAYLAQNIRDAEERLMRPVSAHRYGKARGFGVTTKRQRVATREDGIDLCILAMEGETPSYAWGSPEGWDGPPMTFMSWSPSSSRGPSADLDACAAENPGPKPKTGRPSVGPRVVAAKAWLADALQAEPKASADLKREALRAGISNRTLQRARGELPIRVVTGGYPKTTTWALGVLADRAPGASNEGIASAATVRQTPPSSTTVATSTTRPVGRVRRRCLTRGTPVALTTSVAPIPHDTNQGAGGDRLGHHGASRDHGGGDEWGVLNLPKTRPKSEILAIMPTKSNSEVSRAAA